MLSMPRARLHPQRLGIWFAIFASILVATVVLALLLEQLTVADGVIRALMFATPLLLFAACAASVRSHDPLEFYAANRTIPAFFLGLSLSMTSLGGIGVMAVTGTLFLTGSDAFALVLGWPVGLVLMAVLLAPFLRKFGAYTIPSYLGARLDSRTLRVVAAAVLAVPVLLVLVAEIRLAAWSAAILTGLPQAALAVGLVTLVALMLVGGGMRALTWTSSAKALAVIITVVVPVTIWSLMVANLPLPQLTAGNAVRNVMRIEAERGVPLLFASSWLFDLPGPGLEPLTKRFLQSFGRIGAWAFSASVLIIGAGLAAMPALLMRAGTTTGVHAVRKSMGWAVVITCFVLLTLSAIAIFLRAVVLDQIVGQPTGRLPQWFQVLQQAGLASIDPSANVVAFGTVRFARDGVLAALPIATGLPWAFTYLALVGAMTAALAAMAAQMLALGASAAEDVMLGLDPGAAPDSTRVLAARIGLAIAACASLAISTLPADPLELALSGLAISASAGFPVLVLSVLWKRLNAAGAMAGLITGFGVAVALMLTEKLGLTSLAGPLTAVIAAPAATVAIVLVTLGTKAVGRHPLELVRDMRVPGGETLMDRERRLARLKRHAVA